MVIKKIRFRLKKPKKHDFEEAAKEPDLNLDEPMQAIKKSQKTPKAWLVMLIIGIVSFIGGIVMFLIPLIVPEEVLPDLIFPSVPSQKVEDAAVVYSDLTGLQLADAAIKTAPTFCVQTPNGIDGARPQVGLHQAGVIFEAIAERGITRFAAIYQNPTSAVIGPIRSLRLYYLQWDTPFDCTIVHAGGADDAIAAVRSGGYKDLTENYVYMYRGNYPNYDRLWNNLFTTGPYLMQFSSDYGYTTSNVNGFSRMTPAVSNKARIDNGIAEKLVITEPATNDINTVTPSVSSISLIFGGLLDFNVDYVYNVTTNSYDRSYANGEAHLVYDCPTENLGEPTPEDVCTLKQMSPSVVIAIVVDESLAWDGYHEDITAVGSGSAYIFQNGYAVPGVWTKNSVDSQIVFTDANGQEITLAPGQTFVEAIPTYGSIEY